MTLALSSSIVTLLILLKSSHFVTSDPERIITNPNDVEYGVPVDFSYNETLVSRRFTSVPGCPKSEFGYPWVYYGVPSKCYLAGSRGPCEEDQKLFIEVGSTFGYCNCECFKGLERMGGKSAVQICKNLQQGTTNVYIPKQKICSTLYDQGPCKHNEWVELVNNTDATLLTTVCKVRSCPPGQEPYTDPKSGRKECAHRFIPYASPQSIFPEDCKQRGMEYSTLLKICVKSFDFDF